jgi:hypothetical protein
VFKASSNVCPDYREKVATHSVTRIEKRLKLHVEEGEQSEVCPNTWGVNQFDDEFIVFFSQYEEVYGKKLSCHAY